MEEKEKMKHCLLIFTIFVLPIFLFTGCDLIEKMTVHEIIVEDNAYLRGRTSGEGYVNLMDDQFWKTYKSVIKEITEIKIQYRVTRNDTPTDISVDFYFGENQADVFLGNAFLAKGETHSELMTLEPESSYYQLIDLILRKDAFHYAIQGNTNAAFVDFEPVRITISGTFDII
jgi:hypothetical protein